MMRFFYLMLKITLQYTTRVFYPRQKMVNAPKEFYGRTIYVSNHAASFMDPLIAAGLRRPIVFFMTRSDVFTPITKPILWAAHMLPIYRQHDGGDTASQNERIFDKCSDVLKFGRNLLIFGEGFTDDIFIRRLKPVKKGAARIGFWALEKQGWKHNIYVAAVGINYSDPNLMRSDVLVATDEKICLNDYKEAYLENPNKAINDVTKLIESRMQAMITHVEDKDLAPFHEQIQSITRKGMHPRCSNVRIPLEKRWRYSQSLANWLNKQDLEANTALAKLKTDMGNYFQLLKKMKLREEWIYDQQKGTKGSISKELFRMTVLAPFALLGLLHCGIPYILIKRFVEKTFKRKVFWGSVKLLLGKIVMGLINIPFIFLFYHFIYPSYWLGFAYYLAIGLFGLAAYQWKLDFERIQIKRKLSKMDLSKIFAKRDELVESIHQLDID